MDKVDYKKLNKELYAPKDEPSVIMVPSMNFIMVDGHGDPNDVDGEYNKAVELLYALSYSIKMGRKKGQDANTKDFLDYVIPPLEGLWWLEDINDTNFYSQKENYCWTSMVRLPEFISIEVFDQAKEAVKKKKSTMEVTKARLETFEEGLCVQCMHIGPYATEPVTIEKIDNFIKANGMSYDIGSILPGGRIRRHHEIYLSDPRKANLTKMQTILRHPVRTSIIV